MGTSPERLRKAVDNNRRKRGVSSIDLPCQHVPDPHLSIEDVDAVTAESVNVGKACALALSSASDNNDTVPWVHAAPPLRELRSRYFIFDRASRRCFRFSLGSRYRLSGLSPRGQGCRSGAVKPGSAHEADDLRGHIPDGGSGNFEARLDIVGRLIELAEGKGTTFAQLFPA